MPVTLKSRLPGIASELHPRVSRAVKEGAEEIAEIARRNVHVRSGELQNRITVKNTGPAEYAVVAGDGEAFYAHMLEGGTDVAPPYPFLLPAFEEHQHEVAADIQDVLRTL